MIKIKTLASAITLTAVCSAHAVAQGLMLEEVIVTAQKRTENLQDVPISIIAISGEKVNDFAIIDLQELTTYVPNVTINNGAGTPNLFIRGVGSGTNSGFEQSVGMFIDGVYAGRGALARQWPPTQIVEVRWSATQAAHGAGPCAAGGPDPPGSP